MKKFAKGLLVASLAVGAVNAVSSVNKTFFASRPVGVNLPMEGTTWHSQINMPEGNTGQFGGSFQLIGFYQDNLNESGMGRYFGINNNNSFREETYFCTIIPVVSYSPVAFNICPVY